MVDLSRYGNTARVAADAIMETHGLSDVSQVEWKPGQPYPEKYIIRIVSEGETCPYCDALKAHIAPMVEKGEFSVEFIPLAKPERQRYYALVGAVGEKAVVPQVSLFDRRSKREIPIGNREDFMAWLDIMHGDICGDVSL